MNTKVGNRNTGLTHRRLTDNRCSVRRPLPGSGIVAASGTSADSRAARPPDADRTRQPHRSAGRILSLLLALPLFFGLASQAMAQETMGGGITLTLSPSSVHEDVGDARITVTVDLTDPQSADTVVSLSTADDTALEGEDYTAPTSVNLTIPTGDTIAEMMLIIPVVNDMMNEGADGETLLVTGVITMGDLAGARLEAPLTINDNAPTEITLTLNPPSVEEDVGNASIIVTATLEGGTTRSEDTVVSLGTADGTATAGADYTAVASVNLTIPAASASAEMTLTIPIMDDVIDEGASETLSVMGTTTVGLTVTPADLTITDDDAPTGITLALSPNSVAEDVGDASITVTATLDGGTTRSEETVVSLGTADGTATAGADYTAVASVNLTIPVASASAVMTLTIPVMDDVIDEGASETLSVMGMTTVGLTVTPADLTITDNDNAPTGITLALSPNSVAEDVGDASITVTATLDGGTTRSEETVVSLGTADGTATAGADYTAVASVNLTIPVASASAVMTLTIPVMDDVIDEGASETLSVMGTTTVGLTVTPADLTITDDDAPTGITLALSPNSVAEDVGDASITVTATLDGGTTRSEETVVSLGTADGTATAGADYTAVASVNLTIPVASASAVMTLTIPVMDDVIDEGASETLSVMGTTTVGLTVTPADLTITDDDAPTGITLTLSPNSVAEDVGDASITVTATLDGGTTRSEETVVSLGTADGTATVGADYTAVASVNLTIPAASASAVMTLTIPVMDDVIDEGASETLSVMGTTTVGLTVTPADLTITDDDAPTGITLALSPNSVAEDVGDASITVTATLDGGTTRSEETVVSLGTADGTATAGADYTAVASVNLTIPAASASAVMTLTIPVMDDVIDEGASETLSVMGTTTVGLTVTPADLTITDDDAPTGITLALSPNSVAEDVGDASITVTATLDGGTTRSEETVVSLGTADGTATAGADYTAVASVNLTIPVASASAVMTLTIPVMDDVIDEGASETLSVMGTTTVGLTVTPADLTITDDDAPTGITLTLSPNSVAEDVGDASITVTATLDGGTTRSEETVVSLGTADGTATVGADYTAVASVNLTIPAASASAVMTLTIPVMDDVIDEGASETLSVMGTTTVGLTVTPADLTITDNDNDVAGVIVSETIRTIPENGGTDTYTVRLNSQPTADVMIAVASADTEVAMVSPSSLTFTTADWNTAQTVTVTGMNDNIDNVGDARTVMVTHAATSSDPNYNGANRPIASTTVTITDDDDALARFAALNEVILSEVIRSMTDSTVNAITQRIKQSTAPGPKAATLTLNGRAMSLADLTPTDNLSGVADNPPVAGMLTGIARSVADGSWQLGRALGNSSFMLPTDSDLAELTLWGGGDYRELSGESGALDWDGDLGSGILGADTPVSDTLLVGLAVSWQSGDFDYKEVTADAAHSGDYEVNQFSAQPYIGWSSPDGRQDLWATAGYGWGDVEIDDQAMGRQSSNLNTQNVGVGGSGQLLQSGASTLRLKGQFHQTWAEVEGNNDLLRKLNLDVRRLRLALEGTHEQPLANGAQLTPTVEVGLRYDAGDGPTGSGIEVGAGLRFTAPAIGLSAEGRGRVLLAHSGDYDDWGLNGTLRFAPQSNGRGLAFSLQPAYGATASRVTHLWEQDSVVSPTADAPHGARMDADLSYGLDWAEALVTPYVRLSLAGSPTYRIGSRLQLHNGLALSLEGLRQEADTRSVEHGILLKLKLDW